ncbi:MAG TPA: DUF4349 domain-containing protein [Actinomycetota bacterium]|nr:DUF4349 domain-containing protein [Actinomycetota bacterium]
MQRSRNMAAWMLLAVVATAVLGGCSSDSGTADAVGDSDDSGRAAREVTAAEPAPQGADSATGESTGGGGSSSSGGGFGGSDDGAVMDAIAQVPEVRANVIKTAEVSIEVPADSLDEAVRDGIAAAGRYGGFVLSTTMEDARRGSANVVVRVPAEHFERAMTELEGLGRVTSEVVTGRDVGQEFVDLDARIRNLEAQETVMLRLMERAQSVSDTIKVQRELQGIQLEIERLTGRLRYLKDQADMSTISLSFFEKGAAASDPPKVGMLHAAWNRAIDLALGVVAAIIVSTGVIVPLALILLAGYLVVRVVRPRFTP